MRGALTSTSKQDAALFAEMLSLPNDGCYPVLDLAPQQGRQKTLEALTSQLAGLASQQCARPCAMSPVHKKEVPMRRCPIMSGTVASCFSATVRNCAASSRTMSPLNAT